MVIPITRGLFSEIDDADADLVLKFKWHALPSHRVKGLCYVATSGRKNSPFPQKTVRLHRMIMGITNAKIHIDHVDGNGLNNKRSNLRIANRIQQGANRRRNSNNTSGFKGVFKNHGRWAARIRFKNKLLNLGNFSTTIEAAEHYNQEAIRLFGEFAHLNVIPL